MPTAKFGERATALQIQLALCQASSLEKTRIKGKFRFKNCAIRCSARRFKLVVCSVLEIILVHTVPPNLKVFYDILQECSTVHLDERTVDERNPEPVTM